MKVLVTCIFRYYFFYEAPYKFNLGGLSTLRIRYLFSLRPLVLNPHWLCIAALVRLETWVGADLALLDSFFGSYPFDDAR